VSRRGRTSEHGRLTVSTRDWTLDSEQERQDSELGRLTASTINWTLDSERERQDSEQVRLLCERERIFFCTILFSRKELRSIVFNTWMPLIGNEDNFKKI